MRQGSATSTTATRVLIYLFAVIIYLHARQHSMRVLRQIRTHSALIGCETDGGIDRAPHDSLRKLGKDLRFDRRPFSKIIGFSHRPPRRKPSPKEGTSLLSGHPHHPRHVTTAMVCVPNLVRSPLQQLPVSEQAHKSKRGPSGSKNRQAPGTLESAKR